MDENFGVALFWVLLAQLGVKIDAIQDNGVVNFSVPSLSDYTAEVQGLPLVEGAPKGESLSGELLLQMANSYFEENGLHPNGRIRSEYWTQWMGEIAAATMQKAMQE